MKWSGKSLGSRLQHEFFYTLVRLRLVFLARAFLYVVVGYYTLLPSVRQRAYPYLRRRFPRAGKWALLRHCFRLYLCFAQGLLERCLIGILGKERVRHHSAMEQKFHNCIPSDTGCIILTAHIGVWQLGIIGMEPLQRPVNIVQWLNPEDNDKHYFEHQQRGTHTIRIINSQNDADAMFKIITALQRKELVCIAGDRVAKTSEHADTVAFLGGTIQLPSVAFLLASMAQVPIVIAFTVLENNSIDGALVERVDVPPNLRRNPQHLQIYLQRFAAYMETMVTSYPYHFFNFYDMWSNDDSTTMP